MATFEILIAPGQKASSRRMLQLAQEATGGVVTSHYEGKSDWLVIFGWGGSVQGEAMRNHRATGRPVLVMDYSFFTRVKDRVRISINENFPTRHLGIMGGYRRFDRLGIQLDDLGKPQGRVVILELTGKSCAAFGYAVGEWERQQVRAAREIYGEREIVIRPKRQSHVRLGLPVVAGGIIADAIRGAGLVVVHHSNVAIDCAIHGVDCVASHGIGMGFYPAKIGGDAHRSPEQRLQFLEQAAWFDWSVDEFPQMIEWAQHVNEVAP